MDLVHIAQTVKQARLKQKLTIAQVAQKTGLSKGLISRLENFRLTPSLNVLDKVSEALGLKMADLFQKSAPPAYVFGNIDEGERIVRDEGERFGIRYFSLAYQKLDRSLTPFVVEYNPCDADRGFLMHESEEFFVVLSGKVEFFIYDDDNRRVMTQGDTVYLSRDIPHKVKLCKGAKSARALVVYHEIPAVTEADTGNEEAS